MYNDQDHGAMDLLVQEAWKVIAPFWPLSHLVSINPLYGLEELDIEQALVKAAALFQSPTFPTAMSAINRQTIKWMQAFFDRGQATLNMPMRHLGLYQSWRKLAWFDEQIHRNDPSQKTWLAKLPKSAPEAIAQVFSELNMVHQDQALFCTLMLTTLPGWAAHIQYQAYTDDALASLKYDYLAIRLIMTRLMWDQAVPDLLQWHDRCLDHGRQEKNPLESIEKSEAAYIQRLLQNLNLQKTAPDLPTQKSKIKAQLVFCIDVRSEPLRYRLEQQGPYETFGFSGFFGLPVGIHHPSTGESFASCPVLLKPLYYVDESPVSKTLRLRDAAGYRRISLLNHAYQSLKYNIGTAFSLVVCLGFFSGLWMAIKTLYPLRAVQIRDYLAQRIRPKVPLMPSMDTIPLTDQCHYAEFALRSIGLVKDFAPILVLCGHGSTTENNAYASILHCGACGGHHGVHNAKILALILNNPKVRTYLAGVGIHIPDATLCLAAQHNTTTDEVELCTLGFDLLSETHPIPLEGIILDLKKDLSMAGIQNSQNRCKAMGFYGSAAQCAQHTKKRSTDWAQIRPEWGLAGNACFMIAPRSMSQWTDLEGRAFLHSYDYRQDPDGAILTTILTAPMVVAQWINHQYLFSTLDPIAYGSGSKITKNITSKIGVMQGVSSDLMTGLPLQSVYNTDTTPYHQPLRLNVVVHAPQGILDSILSNQPVLQKLFGRGWVILTCIDPDRQVYFLNRDFSWRKIF